MKRVGSYSATEGLPCSDYDIVDDILKNKFNMKVPSKACKFGLEHESVALSEYVTQLQERHEDARVERPGLIVHPQYGFLHASPDAIMSCKCCGRWLVEVKCSTVKEHPLDSCRNGKLNYVKLDANSRPSLVTSSRGR